MVGKAVMSSPSRDILIAKSRPTQRAPDWWESARFQAVFLAQGGSGKMAWSRLTHQRVTPTVRRSGKLPAHYDK